MPISIGFNGQDYFAVLDSALYFCDIISKSVEVHHTIRFEFESFVVFHKLSLLYIELIFFRYIVEKAVDVKFFCPAYQVIHFLFIFLKLK